MTQLHPYVTFQNDCREAMEFYKACLGGELTVQTVGETPAAKDYPPETHDKVMHASLSKDSTVLLMASDKFDPSEFILGNNIALTVNCSSEEEINTYFSKFSEGGKVLMPLQAVFWGATFGLLVDKFGIQWMFNYDKNPQK